jgi:hypothetical protein
LGPKKKVSLDCHYNYIEGFGGLCVRAAFIAPGFEKNKVILKFAVNRLWTPCEWLSPSHLMSLLITAIIEKATKSRSHLSCFPPILASPDPRLCPTILIPGEQRDEEGGKKDESENEKRKIEGGF